MKDVISNQKKKIKKLSNLIKNRTKVTVSEKEQVEILISYST